MILIVDDEASNRESLRAVLEGAQWRCLEADSGESALELLRSRMDVNLLITDFKMTGMDGVELLELARLERPEIGRILVTAFATIESTVSAMKAGAFDVLPKPQNPQTPKPQD
jgi:DNA-binding NtrC family response regulator